MQGFPKKSGLLAVTVPLLLAVATSAPAQQEPQPRPAVDPSTLPPLPPPLPPPAVEPVAPPSADTKVDVGWRAPEPQEPPTTSVPPVHPEESESRWYGWQIILTDGAALASVAAASRDSAWGDLALVLYLAGGPVVHFAHEHLAKGAGSAALRVGVPLGGALVGALVGAAAYTGSSCSSYCSTEAGAAVGILAGLLAASILDIALLAYDEKPVRSAARSGPPPLHLAPVAGLPRDSRGTVTPTLGLAGSF
jgi:hypothetical protein